MSSLTTELPEELIRGIGADCLDEEGNARTNLFTFNDNPDNQHFVESSINWYDNSEALTHIFKQKKESGALQFERGAAILSKNEVDAFIKRRLSSIFEYERKEIDGNKYHGNLLIIKSATKDTKRKIASGLALLVNRIETKPSQ